MTDKPDALSGGQRVRHCSTFMGPTCPYGDLCSTGCRRLVAQSGETFTLTRPVPVPVGLEREALVRLLRAKGPGYFYDTWDGIYPRSTIVELADAILALSDPDRRTEPASAPIGLAEVKDVDH